MAENFKPGDRVRHRAEGDGVIESGPFEHIYGSNFYLIKLEKSGKMCLGQRGSLEPIPPADPRVDAVAKAIYENHLQRPWEQAHDVARTLWMDHAHAALAALDAHSGEPCKYGRCNEVAQCTRCDMDAAEGPRRVRDSSGDIWTQETDGTWTFTQWANGESAPTDISGEYTGLTWESLYEMYDGNLTEEA